ncbi:MAG: sulfatase-like hydrolase/transferase, partial [Pseudomonadota bacterium]|nr:sulfatase-like hydrolase/transferase [Pseudomonadota bacterium]
MFNPLSKSTFCTLVIAVLMFSGHVHSEDGKPPNILLLVAEDLSPRLGSFGDPLAKTPNIDTLAQRSTRFTQVFT